MHANAVESLLPYITPQDDTNSTSSTPHPNTSPRDIRILDIGSGSGYLTHVFAELILNTSGTTSSTGGKTDDGRRSKVVGLEHIQALRDLGERNMRKSENGKRFLDSGMVEFVKGDGRKGWVEKRKEDKDGFSGKGGKSEGSGGDMGWDAIHVGAAAVEIHQELVDQLRSPGRYVRGFFFSIKDILLSNFQFVSLNFLPCLSLPYYPICIFLPFLFVSVSLSHLVWLQCTIPSLKI